MSITGNARGWKRRVNVAHAFQADDLTFEQRRDEIVRVLERSGWGVTNDLVYSLIQELAEACDEDDFDAVWDMIYDEADADRVWIATIH